MKKDKEKGFEDSSLRQKAENEIEKQAEKVILPDNLSGQISDIGEMQRLLHELEVHQIELKMQNLELQRAVEKATTATELYDFAPTGYFLLESDGLIFQLNLRGAQMLGNVRSKLVESNFMRFVSQETLPVFNKFLHHAFETYSKQTCEIALSIQGKPSVYLYIEGIVSAEKQKCLVTAADITERKRMEELLQSNYSLLRMAGKTARFGGWVLDLDENKVTWSDEVAAIHGMPAGYSPSLEEGVNYYAPEWRNKITKVIADCIQAGIPFDEDMEIMTAKGNRIWVRTIGEAIRSANGKIIAIYGAFQDISERKRTEESLRKSEDLLSLMMKYTPVYTFIKEVTATKSITLNASENFQQMVGIPASEMIGKSMNEIFPAEFAAKITADDFAVCASGKIFNEEEELNGRNYRTIKFPISQGDKNLLAGYTIDITEQKQAEKSLRESEARFRGVFDQSPVGSVISSLDSRFVRCNAAFCNFLGYSEDEMIGRSFSEFTYPEDQELGQKAMNELLEEKLETVKLQKRYVRKDGRVVWGEISISLVRDEENRPVYFLPIIQDITESRQTEEALKESETRFRDLNVTKDKFFSIIAHDLRSPFNGILGFSNILVDQIQEKNYEGIEEYARVVQTSAQRALSLLMNLLEWSRSQTGLVKFSAEYVEIGILIDDVVSLFIDMAKQKSIELTIELSSKVIVFGDKYMISTIMRNLVSNALKYTNPGGKIVISAERKPDEILFSVADNGVGMKESALEKMFRIDVSSSTKGTNDEGGTGLGLILCKEFVDKHGGKIWAESEIGNGSTFFFTIPSKQMI